MAQSTLDISDLLDHPFQPTTFCFPLQSFGKIIALKRSILSSWFHHWKWVHYDATMDAALCFLCSKAAKQGKIKLKKALQVRALLTEKMQLEYL